MRPWYRVAILLWAARSRIPAPRRVLCGSARQQFDIVGEDAAASYEHSYCVIDTPWRSRRVSVSRSRSAARCSVAPASVDSSLVLALSDSGVYCSVLGGDGTRDTWYGRRATLFRAQCIAHMRARSHGPSL